MTNPENDPEWESMFSLTDDEDDSDDEYFPDGPSGRILQEVEFPYNRADRIQQANRELFSEPPMKKKQPRRVTFDQIPTILSQDENGNYIELLIGLPMSYDEERSSSGSMQQRRLMYKRRETPATMGPYQTSSISGQLVIPRLVIPPPQPEPLPSTSTPISNQDRRRPISRKAKTDKKT